MRSIGLVWLAGCAGGGAPGDWVDATYDHHRFVIPVEVEGESLRCFVDTGSDTTWFRSDLRIYGRPRVEVGGYRWRVEANDSSDKDADLASMTYDGVPPDCWIGWDALRDLAITVDPERARVRVGPSGPDSWLVDDADLGDPIVAPMPTPDEVPVVTALAQDVEVQLIPDLGADIAMLLPEIVDRMADPPWLATTEITTAEGRVSVGIGLLDAVEISGVAHEDVEFVTYDSPAVAQLGEELDGVLGGSTFGRFVATFDGREETLTLQPEED